MNKIAPTFDEAVADIPDGAIVMVGGFAGPGGMPQNLIRALRDHGVTGLTIIGNTAGVAGVSGFGALPGDQPVDVGILVDNGQVNKAVASFPVSPSASKLSAFELAYREGKVELELVPQGTLAERIRAGGAGIPAYYTATSVGTLIAQDKETRVFEGREYVIEHALKADFALLRAHQADTLGNAVYRGTSQSFNGVMAAAATVTILEVDGIVEPGELDSGSIHTPAVYVDRIVEIR